MRSLSNPELFKRVLFPTAFALALTMGAGSGGRAAPLSVTDVQAGADGANGEPGTPDNPGGGSGGDGGSATASAQYAPTPGTDLILSATALGGNGGDGAPGYIDPSMDIYGYDGAGGWGGDATATAQTLNGKAKSVQALASAQAGSAGNGAFGFDIGVGGAGGAASATSYASSRGAASSQSVASGGSSGSGWGNGWPGGDASATSQAISVSGPASATATATGGQGSPPLFYIYGSADASASAQALRGGTAQALSNAVGYSSAQSSAQTFFGRGNSVTALAGGVGGLHWLSTNTTNAITQVGAGQSFSNPGQTAYAFGVGSPSLSYTLPLIVDAHADKVAGALTGPGDMMLGAGILGGNYTDGGDGAATLTFDLDLSNSGDFLLGLIDSQTTGFGGGNGFGSVEFTASVNGDQLLDYSTSSLSDAQSYFHDDVINLGNYQGKVELTFGYNLSASDMGGFGVDFVFGGSTAPEPSSWAMMLVGFAGLGLAGYRRARRRPALG